jgi:tetratricopeptide (TPR) repeat protein
LLDRRPELLTNRRVSVLHLEPLRDEAMGQLLTGVVDGLTDDLLTTLVQRAEGIPLYAVETVRALLDRGQVVGEAGAYLLAAGEHVDLEAVGAPASLHALVASRLDALPSDERRVVANASVLGMSFTPAALGALTGENGELPEIITRLVRRDVLTIQSDRFAADRGDLQFVQSVVRKVAYETLSRRDRRQAHLAAAAFLEGEEATEDLAPVIAQHLLDAAAASPDGDGDAGGFVQRAVTLLVAAADRARELGAVDEALRHLELAHARSTDAEQRLAINELIAHAAAQGGLLDLCIARADEVLAAAGDDPVRSAVIAGVAASAHTDADRPRDAIALIEPHLEALGEDDASQRAASELLHQLHRAHLVLCDFELVGEISARQLDVAERLGDDTTLFRGLMAVGHHWATVGRPRAALTLLRRAIDFARRTGRPALIVHGLLNLAAISSSQDLDLALTTSEEAVALSPRASATYRSFAYLNRVIALYLAGDWSEMRQLLVEMQAAPLLSAPDAHRALSDWVSYASHEGLHDAETVPESDYVSALDQPWNSQSRINAARAAGDRAALAQASADGLAATVDAMGTSDDFSVLWPHFVQASLDAGALEQAAAQVAFVEASSSGLVPALLAAQLHRFRGLLAVARGEDPEVALRAGIAALDAFGARPDAARTRHALAVWLLGQGRDGEADELLTPARAIYEEIGAARWLAELPERTARLAADPG